MFLKCLIGRHFMEWNREGRTIANMAAKVVSKILQHGRLRMTGSLNDTASVFRSVTIRKVRWSSTSSKLSNKLLQTENTDDSIHERMHVGNVRWLCETEQTPQEVSRLFNRFLNLPDQYRTDSLNSALYWFLYYGKIEEALKLKTLIEEHGISKTYSTYSSLAVLYSKCSQLGNRKDFFDEMTKDGLTPTAQHYAPFLEAAVEKGDLIGAFDSITDMEQSTAVQGRNSDIYTALIRACAGQQNKYLTNKVLGVFHDFHKHQDLLSDDTLNAIKLWFDGEGRTEWITSWTDTSATFHCEACKQKLAIGEFSAVELEELKHSLARQLWERHTAVKQVKCFTSAGNFIDSILPVQLDKIPLSIEQFIKKAGPYDVVIDGLNVGYSRGFFEARRVQNVVLHFTKQNKRVLVVGSSPMRLYARAKKGAQTPLGALMDFLANHEHCGVICLAGSSMDDLYFLSAAMHCGPGTLLVSNDKFLDYIDEMDPLLKAQFTRWQKLYQMKLEGFIGENPVFATQKPFEIAVQTTGDTWHFPSRDGNRWLCAKKAVS